MIKFAISPGLQISLYSLDAYEYCILRVVPDLMLRGKVPSELYCATTIPETASMSEDCDQNRTRGLPILVSQ